jgi:hypothetical protein
MRLFPYPPRLLPLVLARMEAFQPLWPAGCSLKTVPELRGLLVVAPTPDALAFMAQLLAMLDLRPRQVRVAVSCYLLDADTLTAQGQDLNPPAAAGGVFQVRYFKNGLQLDQAGTETTQRVWAEHAQHIVVPEGGEAQCSLSDAFTPLRALHVRQVVVHPDKAITLVLEIVPGIEGLNVTLPALRIPNGTAMQAAALVVGEEREGRILHLRLSTNPVVSPSATTASERKLLLAVWITPTLLPEAPPAPAPGKKGTP